MKIRKSVKILALVTVMSTAAISTVQAVSGTGYNGSQHGSMSDFHNSGEYDNTRNRQMIQATPMLQSAMNQVSYARQNYGHMQSSGDPRRISAARSMLTNAETMLATVMADITGVSGRQIGDMRNSGLSWRQVGVRIGIDMTPAANRRNNAHEGDYQDRFMGNSVPTDNYDYHIDMHGNDTFHSGGGSADGYGNRGFAGHGGGMMGGMH